MKSCLFFAILLSCCLAEISSQATDCEMGKENCNADSSGCTGTSDVHKDFCNMTAEPEDDVKLLWESSALAKFEHGSSRSCLEMTMFCIQDEICNRLLVPQVKACSENHNKCNATQCQRAVQKFYDNLPPKVAGMLVFCDCGPSDEPCQQVQGILHARLCSGDRDLPPTCLEVIDKCMEDTFCRERYELLQSKCWGDEKGLCQDYDNDKDCLLTTAEESTTCMRYHECRAAYIGTRGTFLQVPCTCNGLQNTEQSTCKQFQNMLHHRSCSSKL
ncbi:hypothetical protein AOXY_G7863 [Acipenser oxyrinchus oxyrinchus]|uniref:GDNF/GAS1 domain-containing protein n=1 Tax=Acipenser oxyrinchus oxyrinchus TaxID=40147 RepID=A0AAD8GAT7_ACIOX|nr:hypothetical protein AOXY_G7863 [Acipenser oxyrinchus oxyrinchus]